MKIMIIPAAGRGSRLNYDGPKCLYPLAGKPLLEYIVERYRTVIEHFVVVVNPDYESEVRRYFQQMRKPVSWQIEYQQQATGMLDAILEPVNKLSKPSIEQVWVTWCDQVAISQQTVSSLQSAMNAKPMPELAMPSIMKAQPYIHLQRDGLGRVSRILQRREGDNMPEVGENDCGLFALSDVAYFDLLPVFSQQLNNAGDETGERNFLPFIAWLSQQDYQVDTFSAQSDVEAIGINTVEDAGKISQLLDL